MHKEELLALVNGMWSLEQVDNYIKSLEHRLAETKDLMTELKKIRRRKSARKEPVDTGGRGGK